MNYLIARPWGKGKTTDASRLCIWSFGPGGEEIQTGTPKQAEKALEYVKRREKADGEETDGWAVYEVVLSELSRGMEKK